MFFGVSGRPDRAVGSVSMEHRMSLSGDIVRESEVFLSVRGVRVEEEKTKFEA